MACFLVPAGEAVVGTIVKKAREKKEKADEKESKGAVGLDEMSRIPFSRKLGWLNNLLWGGSGLLAFEHVWHGEVTPWFPFLTGAKNSADAAEMLQEMSTTGVGMAVLVTAVWAGILIVVDMKEKHFMDAIKRNPSQKKIQ